MSAAATSPGAACVLLRVWLPDRPGALGAVASRIGAVRGDIVGIDVLERNEGVAIDEFGVVLSDPELLPLGRTGNECRERERAQLLALARIADHVWRRLDPGSASASSAARRPVGARAG